MSKSVSIILPFLAPPGSVFRTVDLTMVSVSGRCSRRHAVFGVGREPYWLLLSFVTWPFSSMPSRLPAGGIVWWWREVSKERTQTAWVQIPALPFIGCMALRKLLLPLCLHCFNCKMGLMLPTFIGLSWGLRELIHIKLFKQCRAQNKYF